MATQWHHYGAACKARVALEALKRHKTIHELALDHVLFGTAKHKHVVQGLRILYKESSERRPNTP